ncbi:MAG: hypothetical protein Q6K80_06210 [Thermostichus sp. DG_1_6_bins_120]
MVRASANSWLTYKTADPVYGIPSRVLHQVQRLLDPFWVLLGGDAPKHQAVAGRVCYRHVRA